MNKESLAFVFPGQGTQRVGMADPLFSQRNPDLVTIANRTFEETNDLLGLKTNLKSLCLNGPDEELDTPGITEPAVLVTSIAALRFLGYYGLTPDVVAGHSLGEYSALVAAEALSFIQAVRLVRARGLFMEEAGAKSPGKMTAILGLSLSEVEAICAEAGAEVANINGIGQIVISGHNNSVIYASDMVKNQGGKAMDLRVSIAAHSSLMEPARQQIEMLLQGEPVLDPNPKTSFVQNVTGDYARTGEEIKRGLIDQITGRVQWLDTIKRISRRGKISYVDVGPGQVLAKMIERIDPNASVRRSGEIFSGG